MPWDSTSRCDSIARESSRSGAPPPPPDPDNRHRLGPRAVSISLSEKISILPTHCDKLFTRLADMMIPLITTD